MKAFALTSVALVLVSFPALAGHGKHAHHASRSPTAMHTVQVHFKDASITRRSDKKPVERQHEREHERGKKRSRHHAHAKPKPPCLHEAVTIGRGTESDKFPLTRCDGEPAPDAVEMLSILGRPGSVPRPARGAKATHIRRLDVGLVERLQRVADHFGHGHAVSMHIISGYRPKSVGSYHAKAQALDFRVDGVTNEQLVAYCKTLPDTGCGYYPNSTFVHLDVRPKGTGHVAWIDASGPGEKAHYVAEWPLPQDPPKGDFAERLTKILPPLPIDEHPASIVGAEAAQAAM
jgi:hypothetical protein